MHAPHHDACGVAVVVNGAIHGGPGVGHVQVVPQLVHNGLGGGPRVCADPGAAGEGAVAAHVAQAQPAALAGGQQVHSAAVGGTEPAAGECQCASRRAQQRRRRQWSPRNSSQYGGNACTSGKKIVCAAAATHSQTLKPLPPPQQQPRTCTCRVRGPRLRPPAVRRRRWPSRQNR